MSAVETLFKDLSDASQKLLAASEISLSVSIEENHRKTLLLSAASYFEWRLTSEVRQFVDEISAGNHLIKSLVESKAISRQFHTWFDWKTPTAAPFFSMFGAGFKEHMSRKVKSDASLSEGVKSFLYIGATRNQLVHMDYATFPVEKTPAEIFEIYKRALVFVDRIGPELRECSLTNAA